MENYLFNFSVSYLGGGYKRLYEFSKWFNNRDGATFIVNEKNSFLSEEFRNNKYYIVKQSLFQRIFNDCSYLEEILIEQGNPYLYYSYGIPLYKKIASVNWFHLSNVLPLVPFEIQMSLINRVKFIYLGAKIRKGCKFADVISAESEFSLGLFNLKYKLKLFLSVNGSDDEIYYLNNQKVKEKEDIVLVIGTQWYKTIRDSYLLFLELKKKEPLLRLVIIGKSKAIPRNIINDVNVHIISKFLDRAVLIQYLEKCKYYISTTLIENSYNAISEGICFAKDSLVADIPPHRELLKNIHFERVEISKISRYILHVQRKDINGLVLRSWDDIIHDLIKHINTYEVK